MGYMLTLSVGHYEDKCSKFPPSPPAIMKLPDLPLPMLVEMTEHFHGEVIATTYSEFPVPSSKVDTPIGVFV